MDKETKELFDRVVDFIDPLPTDGRFTLRVTREGVETYFGPVLKVVFLHGGNKTLEVLNERFTLNSKQFSEFKPLLETIIKDGTRTRSLTILQDHLELYTDREKTQGGLLRDRMNPQRANESIREWHDRMKVGDRIPFSTGEEWHGITAKIKKVNADTVEVWGQNPETLDYQIYVIAKNTGEEIEKKG